MEAIRIEDGTAVRVMWKDSASLHGWKENPVVGSGKIISMGYAVGSNEDSLQISTSITENFHVICPLDIPWGAIENVVLLGEEWNRNS